MEMGIEQIQKANETVSNMVVNRRLIRRYANALWEREGSLFAVLTQGNSSSKHWLFFREWIKLWIIKMFRVLSRVNGQNEYLKESIHVKYLMNTDWSFNGTQCDSKIDRWKVQRKCRLTREKRKKMNSKVTRARRIVHNWLARNGWETAMYRSNVMATVIQTLERGREMRKSPPVIRLASITCNRQRERSRMCPACSTDYRLRSAAVSPTVLTNGWDTRSRERTYRQWLTSPYRSRTTSNAFDHGAWLETSMRCTWFQSAGDMEG